MSTVFSRKHRTKLSPFWEAKQMKEVANSAKGIMDQFPFAPRGGSHLQEN